MLMDLVFCTSDLLPAQPATSSSPVRAELLPFRRSFGRAGILRKKTLKLQNLQGDECFGTRPTLAGCFVNVCYARSRGFKQKPLQKSLRRSEKLIANEHLSARASHDLEVENVLHSILATQRNDTDSQGNKLGPRTSVKILRVRIAVKGVARYASLSATQRSACVLLFLRKDAEMFEMLNLECSSILMASWKLHASCRANKFFSATRTRNRPSIARHLH